MSPIGRRRAALVLAVTLAAPATAYGASPGPSRCEAAKLIAAAGAALGTAKCHATAARSGSAVAPTCLSAARDRMAAGFAKSDAGPCVSVGEASVVGDGLAAFGIGLTAIVGGGPSRCDDRKLVAAGKRAHAALKAHAAHAKRPAASPLGLALAKADLAFARHVASAEAAGDCTVPGNATAVAAAVDAGVTGAVDAIRGTLRDVAARTGRAIGAAVRANLLGPNASYRDTVLRQVGTLTAEYELQWGNLEPTRGTYLWGPIDATVAFAEANGLPIKGAPLVWHAILPAWVDAAMTPAELQAAVDERIDTLMGRYAGRIATWDVVNEAVVDYGAALRDSIFLAKLGPGYIHDAFVRARQADPAALLFYNDFLADGVNVKSDFLYDLIVGLLAAGTPIDGVSFQMHVGGSFGPAPSGASIRQNLERFAALGLIVRISEMDVQVHDLPGGAEARLAAQQAIYHDVVAACVAVPACDSVTFWGITDRYTWIDDYLHVVDAPLPFDAYYRPKAAFVGVRDALLGY